MRLIGLMLARNEDWTIGFTLRAALRWTDGVVVLNHASTDKTKEIIEQIMHEENDKTIVYLEDNDGEKWDEMDHRQKTLDAGRQIGGTHFAIIDADEVLTCNLWMITRELIQGLGPKQILDYPMIPCWRSMGQYRDDNSIWSSSSITLAFKDNKELLWKASGDGYQHHNRPPKGAVWNRVAPLQDKKEGGVIHLQFANWRRLRAKHYWYRMMEAVRWPGRESAESLNKKYNQALDETGLKLAPCPEGWTAGMNDIIQHVNLEGKPWHEDEVKKLWKAKGTDIFRGVEIPSDMIDEPSRTFDGLERKVIIEKKVVIEKRVVVDTQIETKVVPITFLLWMCEGCRLVGVFPYDPVHEEGAAVPGKLKEHHRSVSPKCRETGTKFHFIVAENIREPKILGAFPQDTLLHSRDGKVVGPVVKYPSGPRV